MGCWEVTASCWVVNVGEMSWVAETSHGVRENFCHGCYFPEIQNNASAQDAD